jgi:BNR repeat-containing family member
VVLGRRSLPTGAWSTLELTDYTLAADDAHNTISLGVCPGDGTLHLSFDFWRNTGGTWTRVAMGLPVVANFRGKLAIASSNNVYAILPDLRIAAATAASNFATWTVLDISDAGRFFSDPIIDTARLLTEDKLTVFYPLKSSPNIYVLDYSSK